MVDKELASKSYYHGLLTREDIKDMLVENGDWLLRLTEPLPSDKREFVLSVQTDKDAGTGIKHFVVQKAEDNKWKLMGAHIFESIVSLIEFCQKENIKTKADGTGTITLVRSITRQKWELDHDDIEITRKLGEGSFGEVHKGKLKKRKKNGKDKVLNVAIKLAKLDALTKEQIKEIMREARLMRNLDHPNIVRMYGVAAGQEPLMLVMELATEGALDSYLGRNELLSQLKRMEMISQAARGIQYLHDKNCIHRDIAARNCLYGGGNVKISDFGLARFGETYQMNPKNKVSIRWLAPETMKTACYTRKTDVWSWGVLVWEIFNSGNEPYPGMTTIEVLRFVKDGNHLSISERMDNKEIAEMIEKWVFAYSPDERWSIARVVNRIENTTGLKQSSETNNSSDEETELSASEVANIEKSKMRSLYNPDNSEWTGQTPFRRSRSKKKELQYLQ